MKIVSWNVNGIRSVLGKGFLNWLAETNPDIVCLQETKICERDLDEHVPAFPGYASYWYAAERSGYSGVAVLSKFEPLNVTRGIGQTAYDREGRIITVEYENLFVVNVYAPNAQMEYVRLPFRLAWEETLRAYLTELQKKKPLILCGDLNVAHTPADVGIGDDSGFPGCSPDERDAFDQLLGIGLIDTFRFLHPTVQSYSWWAYANNARDWNQGLRFDYLLASTVLQPTLRAAATHRDVLGSDHGPVSLELAHEPGNTKPVHAPSLPSGQFGFCL